MTGANILDVAKIGIDGALLSINVTQLTDAFGRIHQEVTIKDAILADGIRSDGSFGKSRFIKYGGIIDDVQDNTMASCIMAIMVSLHDS